MQAPLALTLRFAKPQADDGVMEFETNSLERVRFGGTPRRAFPTARTAPDYPTTARIASPSRTMGVGWPFGAGYVLCGSIPSKP